MIPTLISDRWTLELPEHRAHRDETWGSWWPYWEKPRLDSMHANLQTGMTVVDVGAEEGDFPALWASWGCDVVLIEPNPLVWPNIRAIFEANHLAERVTATLVGFAAEADELGSGPGVIVRGIWPECAFGPIIGDHGFANLWERPDIERTTIDRIAALNVPVDAITMDVEGSELRVLRGARATLEQRRPLVWVSVHPHFMLDMYGDRPADLKAYMEGVGYRVEHLAAEHEWHWFCYPQERRVRLPYT